VRPTRFKNPQAEDGQFQLRLIVAYVFMLLMFCLLIARFVWLQVYQYEHFSAGAEQPHLAAAHPAQPWPDHGPQRRRPGAELFAYIRWSWCPARCRT
jgi:hypothetical protein